jgi:hypothetical protein
VVDDREEGRCWPRGRARAWPPPSGCRPCPAPGGANPFEGPEPTSPRAPPRMQWGTQ